MKKVYLFAISFFCVSILYAQFPNDATLNVYLLTPSPGHNCPGVIRCEFNTCNCLEEYGINLSINGNDYGYLKKCYDGTGPGIRDIPLLPGEYEIKGTVSGNSGCSNSGHVFTFNITIDNPSCDPGYFTFDVVQPTGYKCQGAINNIIYHSTNCFPSQLIDIYLVNPDGSEYFLDHYNPNGDNHSVSPGTYGLKAVVNNECSTVVGGIVITEAPCPKLTMTYNPLTQVGFNCPTSINNISAVADPAVCLGTNYFDKYVYDENMNQIGFAHQDGTFNVQVTSGHTYYMRTYLNSECQSDLITVPIPPFTCTATLTEVSRKDSLGGILCPDVNTIELKYEANACYDTWALTETNSQVSGQTGNWSAGKDQTIKVSLLELRKQSDHYRFVATSNNGACIANYKPSGFNTKGCDGKIYSRLIHPESSPGANDAEYDFFITSSACTDLYGDPWVITLVNTSTQQAYGNTSGNRRSTIGGLTAGTYKVSFGDHAGLCNYKDVQIINIPSPSSVALKNNVNPNTQQKIILFPNPATNIISISGLPGKKILIEIININGDIVLKQTTLSKTIDISIAALTPGSYYLKFTLDGLVHRLKFIKL